MSTFFILLFFSCGSKRADEKKDVFPQKNSEFLNSLRKVEPYEMEGLQVSSETTKVYTEDGRLLTAMEVVKLTQSGDYSLDAFRNKENEIVWLFQALTEEMKKARLGNSRVLDFKSDLVGKDAIPFSMKNLDDRECSLQSFKDKVIVMNFWFIACGPCVVELPELNKLVKEYDKKEVVFLAFALDPKEKLLDFLTKRPFDYVIFPESEKLSVNYQVKAFPTHIVIDSNLKIKYHFTGGLDAKGLNDLKKEIDLALNNK